MLVTLARRRARRVGAGNLTVTDNTALPGFADYAGTYQHNGEFTVGSYPIYDNGTRYYVPNFNWFYEDLAAAQTGVTVTFEAVAGDEFTTVLPVWDPGMFTECGTIGPA